MAKKYLIGALVLLTIWIGYLQLQSFLVGVDKEGLFKVGGCYRDDEFGLLYRIQRTVKGQTFAVILESNKYPSQYKMDEEKHWPSNNNSQKLYPVKCP